MIETQRCIIYQAYLLLTSFLISSNGQYSPRLVMMADVVSAVRRHFHSGCVTLLLSSEASTEGVIKLLKLLSNRSIATVAKYIATVNVTYDDYECLLNRPFYVVTQDATFDLLKLLNTGINPSGPTWLIFSNSSIKMSKMFTETYIPLDCMFLVAQEDLNGHFNLTEIYRTNRTMPLVSVQSATWTPGTGLAWDNKTLHERRNNLQGVSITTTAYQNPPVVQLIRKNQKLEVGGMFGRVWYTIASELNFTIEVSDPKVQAAGSLNENGSWNGLMGILIAKQVDVAVAGFTMTSQRAMAVDFTAPLILNRLCLFIRRPESTYEAVDNMLAPFSTELWFAVQGALLGLAACLYLIYILGRRYGSNEDPHLYTIPHVLLCVFGIFCQQGHDLTPRSWSCRIVYWVSYVTALVLYVAYAGALVSFLALQSYQPPFTTLRGMLKNRDYTMAVVGNSAHNDIFELANDELLKAIYSKKFEKNKLPRTMLQGLRSICERNQYTFMTSHDLAIAMSANITCSIMALKDASLPESLTIAVTKNSPYLATINYKLQQLRQSGVLQRIRANSWPYVTEAEKTPWTSVGIEALTPIFSVLVIGATFSFVLLILEMVMKILTYGKIRRKKSSRAPPKTVNIYINAYKQ